MMDNFATGTRHEVERVEPIAWLSVIGNALFVAVAVALPFAQRPGYRISRDAVSILALGKYGWIQTIAFCGLGVGTVALAVVIRATCDAAGRTPALLAIAGALNFVAAGVHTVRVGQAQTAASIVHNVCGVITFVATVAVMFMLSSSFRRDASWSAMARPTRFWAIGGIVALILTGPLAKHFGIAERLLLGVLVSWMLVCGVRALSLSGTLAPRTP